MSNVNTINANGEWYPIEDETARDNITNLTNKTSDMELQLNQINEDLSDNLKNGLVCNTRTNNSIASTIFNNHKILTSMVFSVGTSCPDVPWTGTISGLVCALKISETSAIMIAVPSTGNIIYIGRSTDGSNLIWNALSTETITSINTSLADLEERVKALEEKI